MTKIKTVYSEKYTAQTLTTSMRKLGLVADEAQKLGFAEILEPRDCDIVAKLMQLHDPVYVEAFVEGKEGGEFKSLATSQGWSWTPEIRDGVLEINKGQLTAAEIALAEGIAANVAQGFHHAPYGCGMGFCTFNGLALVAQEHPDKNIVVLDCDEHGGNGTEDFTKRLSNLKQITIHGTSFGVHGSEKSVCISLDSVTGDFTPYRDALERAFGKIDEWEPDLVIYQAGADPHVDDPLGSVGLTTEQMRERDRFVFDGLRDRNIPVLFVLAGGYQEPIREKLMPLHVNTFEEAFRSFNEGSNSISTVQSCSDEGPAREQLNKRVISMRPNDGKYGGGCGLIEAVEYRFLNKDGAGVILDRLAQPEMNRLFDWFADEKGARAGNLFLECAPLFDTAIETQAEIPFPPRPACGEEPAADKSLDYSDGFESGEEMQPHQATHCEENPTVALAYGFFGAGLLWGVRYQQYAVDTSRSPFPVERSIADFLSHIFRAEPGSLSADAGRLVDSGTPSPAYLTHQLVELVPALELVIRSGYRLCSIVSGDSLDTGSYGTHLRYLFCLGLLASGLSAPERFQEAG